jgi:hypothetical protein
MFRFTDRPSLSDLFDARAALRRQEVVLLGAMRDVQTELRSWQGHRLAQEASGRNVPRELCMLWEELAERERELALDLIQVRAALREAQREIQNCIAARPIAS